MTDPSIIIIGAGTAGMVCAISAAESGAQVLVIEKTDRIGGTLHLTGGHLSAAGTRRQCERGIEDSPQSHFEDVMRISQHTANPDLVHLAVNEAPRTIDWLDELGFPFDPETPKIIYGHEPYSQPRTYWGMETGRSILKTLLSLWERHVNAGRIQVKLNCTLRELLMKKGTVTGVKVERLTERTSDNEMHEEMQGGWCAECFEKSEFSGQAVVLATGGYASNPEFFHRVSPPGSRLVSSASPASTGDGIIVAQRIGAKFHHAEKYIASLGGIEFEPDSGRCDWNEAWAAIFSPQYRQPREIYINYHGLRFMAEDEARVDQRERLILKQPGHTFWIIFDEIALVDGDPLVRGWTIETFRQHATQGKCAWVAETISELAEKIKVNEAALQATVSRFNQTVETGDDEFGRKYLQHRVAVPPFYALKTSASSLISFGGLAIDAQLRVLDQNNDPIPGLYAIGEITGAGATSGNAFCGGMLLTPALSLGRLLGQRLAEAFASQAVPG